jgi:hypothetical protein
MGIISHSQHMTAIQLNVIDWNTSVTAHIGRQFFRTQTIAEVNCRLHSYLRLDHHVVVLTASAENQFILLFFMWT